MPALSWLWRGLSGLGNTGVAEEVTLSLARAWFIFGAEIVGANTPSALPGASLLAAAGGAGASVGIPHGAEQDGMSQLAADRLRREQQHRLAGVAAQSMDR